MFIRVGKSKNQRVLFRMLVYLKHTFIVSASFRPENGRTKNSLGLKQLWEMLTVSQNPELLPVNNYKPPNSLNAKVVKSYVTWSIVAACAWSSNVRKVKAMQKRRHFHATICLLLMQMPKISQMNHALKMPISLHWLPGKRVSSAGVAFCLINVNSGVRWISVFNHSQKIKI